jgi:hypothetical protein
MIITYDHLLSSSFLLWVQNLIENRGQAFSQGSGWFYDTQEVYGGRFSYSLPYQPLVADSSIANATIMTGIYLDNTFITTGVSGLVGINYQKGDVYFSSGITYSNNPAHTRLSGNFSVSEFSYKLTSDPEEHILFATKHSLKPKTYQILTGVGPSEETFPIIYIKQIMSNAREWAFGGIENTTITFRLIVLADSQFALDGVSSLIRDRIRSIVPLMTGVSEMPFNAYGGYSGPIYNYNTTFTGKFSSTNTAFLNDVRVIHIGLNGLRELKQINPHVFPGVLDCDLSSYRQTRI